MAFQPLHGILQSLEQTQSNWRSRKQFKALVICWPQVVGVAVAAQTRPVALQRGTLMVATSSAAWAQNLAFERQHLLQKLHQKLRGVIRPAELVDIRFSTTRWASDSAPSGLGMGDSARVWQHHPSSLPATAVSMRSERPSSHTVRPTDPSAAFQHWATQMQARSRHLPLCPQCQCPTPEGELERWSMCALCAPKHWSRSPHSSL